MNLKSKIVGAGIGALLAVSMVFGASAEDVTVGGSVELEGGTCSLTLSGSVVNFGVWKWNGTSYVLNGGSNESSISGTVTSGTPAGCDITVKFGGLVGPGGVIGAENFQGSINGGPVTQITPAQATALAAGVPFNGVPSGSGNAWMQLVSVPNTYVPGTYSGTLSFTVVNAG